MRTVCGVGRRVEMLLGRGGSPPAPALRPLVSSRNALLSGDLGEQRRGGARLDQVDETTCGSAVLVALSAWADPTELALLDGGPPGEAPGLVAPSGFGARYDTRQRQVHRETNRFWPQALGTTPWGMVRWLRDNAPAAGPYRVRLVDDVSRPDVEDALGAAGHALAVGAAGADAGRAPRAPALRDGSRRPGQGLAGLRADEWLGAGVGPRPRAVPQAGSGARLRPPARPAPPGLSAAESPDSRAESPDSRAESPDSRADPRLAPGSPDSRPESPDSRPESPDSRGDRGGRTRSRPARRIGWVTDTLPPRTDLPAQWNPGEVEAGMYQRWVDEGYFEADPDSDKPPFSIVIPPPNVTGSLHMGHAFQHTLMDALCRRRRMQGYEALWLPGMDHAASPCTHWSSARWPTRARAAASSAARRSSSARGSGRPSTAARSWTRCAASATASTGAASASRWTRAPTGPSTRSSNASTTTA